MPKISIIVPIYNVEKYLAKCLESIINQTFRDIEIICVNDGSSDNCSEILETFANIDKRIRVINQKNQGLSAARNSGLCFANGEYIGFIDSDDYISFDFFEKLYNSIIKYNADIAVASIKRKRTLVEKYRVFYKEEKEYFSLKDKLKIANLPKCCYVWNKLYKKEIIKNSFFQEGKYFEDVLWTPEIIKKSTSLITVPNTYYYYRVNKKSIVKQIQNPKKQNDSYLAKSYIVDFYKNNNIELDEKYKKITKKIWYFLNFPILKLKTYQNKDYYCLFGFIILNNFIIDILNNTKIFFKKIFSISVIDYHYVFFILGIQIRKKIKENYPIKTDDIKKLNPILRNPRIIASLTSYPKRINLVHKTIKTIFNQTIKPDEIVLWLSEDEFINKENDLPENLIELKNYGLKIKWCDNLKSYKKLIPALKEYKDDIIITFDDDIYYQDNIIETLLNAYKNSPNCICANRGHRISIKNNNIRLKSNANVYWSNYTIEDYKNTIIGCGGVLYPPHLLNSKVSDKKIFNKILPTQDDIWFWAMAVLNKTKIKITKPYTDFQFKTVENSQKNCLCKINNKTQTGIDGKEGFNRILKQYPELIDIINSSD